MAMREVVLPEENDAPKTYFSFKAIGDSLLGLFVSHAAVPKTYNGESKTDQQYTFQNKDGEWITVSANANLHTKLQNAQLVQGQLVKLVFAATKDIGKPSPMKLISVFVDDGAPRAVTKPAQKPKPASAEDF